MTKAVSEEAEIGRVGAARRLWRWMVWTLKWAARAVAAFAAVSALWVLAYRFVNPPTTFYIAYEKTRLGALSQSWRPLERIAPSLRRATIAAEDARFCSHYGVDVAELRRAVRDWRRGGALRGASTITQQTAKNVFLWHDRSLARKALEFWFAGLMEALWPKERILEVYLNVAEFGEGVFGAEAAAQSAFGASADALALWRAARLAAVLPAPKVRSAGAPSESLARRADAIADGARTLRKQGGAACVGA